jgi:hypothetical protein
MVTRAEFDMKYPQILKEIEELCRIAAAAGVDQEYLAAVLDSATAALKENWYPETDGDEFLWIPLKIVKDAAFEIRQIIDQHERQYRR